MAFGAGAWSGYTEHTSSFMPAPKSMATCPTLFKSMCRRRGKRPADRPATGVHRGWMEPSASKASTAGAHGRAGDTLQPRTHLERGPRENTQKASRSSGEGKQVSLSPGPERQPAAEAERAETRKRGAGPCQTLARSIGRKLGTGLHSILAAQHWAARGNQIHTTCLFATLLLPQMAPPPIRCTCSEP